VDLIRDAESEDIRWEAASILVKTAPNNPTAITTLVDLIRDAESEYIRWEAARILEEIAPK
jgi:HEAT repeat protein